MKKNKRTDEPAAVCAVQTGSAPDVFGFACSAAPDYGKARLYYALREAVPVIDAAVMKLVRLTGGFSVHCSDPAAQRALDSFFKNVPVNGNSYGVDSFVSSYFEQLLTCGTAVGEIVTDRSGLPAALYNAPLDNIELCRNENGFDIDVFTRCNGVQQKAKYPELILLSALDPLPGEICGVSLLRGLPFIAQTMMKIFKTVGTNWERLGNVRFAVTYKPQNDAVDRAFAKERAMQVAQEWSSAMSSRTPKDFVAVGDVQIKVIGADNQILDSEVPVRQLLEQIVAKTGLPPFLLGLSWSTTERMSSQQADALTSEIEAYRRILTPAIERLCQTCLRLYGLKGSAAVMWNDIMLQDMVEIARAELFSAQAQKLEKE